MAKFTYNNSKNVSIGHIFFKFNCGYYSYIPFEDKCNKHSRSSFAKGLAMKFGELMNICCQNLLYAQDLQKQAYDKEVKPWSYVLGEKVWLNSKHIKTKRNRKLEAKLFGPFRVLYPVEKQVYKLELPAKWRIHDVLHVSQRNRTS